MKFSYQWLQSYFKIRLPAPTKLAELLSDHFANVEEVKKQGSDFMLDIEVRPNRAADCFGHWGIAREIAAILKLPLNLPQSWLKENKKMRADKLVRVKVEDQKACPRYTIRVIGGVKVGSSPRWLKERLETCGLQSINNIVDIVNFVMLETNQPLHAFDWEKISAEDKKKTIIVRFAEKNEKLLALDDKTYELDKDILVIANNEEPLGVAGIKGGKSSGVDGKTKIVVLEGANFHPLVIRRGSRKLGLKTDASWRFEHGLDPNLTEVSLARAASLIEEIAGGQVLGGMVDNYPVKTKSKKIELKMALINNLLGVKIKQKEVESTLRSLDFAAKSGSNSLLVEAPTRRVDVSLPEDLVEEIGRILGYHNIPDDPPRIILSPPPAENRDILWEEKARDLFVEAGFSEVWNYSFLSKTARAIFGLRKEELLELENPLDQNRPYLAPSLLPNLLNNVILNSSGFESVKIFELGKIFFRSADQGIKEERRLAAALWGNSRQGFWDLKGGWEFLFEKMGIKDWEWSLSGGRGLRTTGRAGIRTLKVSIGREELGFLGELRPDLVPAPCAKGHLYLSEMNFEKLLIRASERKTYLPLAKNPAAKRDLSLLVPLKTRAAQVKKKIESRKVPHLIKTELFDVYWGKELPNGTKSLAFRFVFQSPEKTLSTQEIERSFKEILETVKTSGWEMRK